MTTFPRLGRLYHSPRDRSFFAFFEEAGANLRQAGELLDTLMRSWPDDSGIAREILICEQHGDRITHDIIGLLNNRITAPFDRQDVYALASALDDVVDFIEEAADFLVLYRVEAPMEQAQELSSVLRQACRVLAQTLTELRDFRPLHEHFVDIERLEHEGDRITREALAALFQEGVDPIVVIRWKDIFERLEQAIDSCKRASNVLQGIVVKHS
jgi:predicted phosphate transport protein (TIGR00153 family)